jgi:hypothetical protein
MGFSTPAQMLFNPSIQLSSYIWLFVIIGLIIFWIGLLVTSIGTVNFRRSQEEGGNDVWVIAKGIIWWVLMLTGISIVGIILIWWFVTATVFN